MKRNRFFLFLVLFSFCFSGNLLAKKEIVFVKTSANNNDSIVIANISNYAGGTAYNVTVIAQGVITEDLLPQFNAA
ncbi:MAG TPA: hypothetical protein PLK12_03780, partial [Prolixibacteraceae bacterium]|nr:hypothetical protein [Prolixibacteraceae bacterium]